ncbi:MAG: tetratricopeptide repeat protein [Candidatus Zipacnadales bacterium]
MMKMPNSTSRWLLQSVLCAVALTMVAWAQEAAPPADNESTIITPPPPFNRWFAQTRWDEAYGVERAAGGNKVKIAEAIEAWKMFLNLYPQAGMANEAAWHIASLAASYGEVPQTIAAYEDYVANFPDGDYAADALWSLISQYMRIPDWDAVYRKYDEFLQRFEKSPYGDEALNSLASQAATARNYDLALNLYNQLLQRYPTSDYCDDAVSAIAAIHVRNMDIDAASEAYFHLAQTYPYSSLVEPGIQNLIYAYYRSGNVMKAVELGEQFLAAFPHSSYGQTVRMYMYYAVRSARLTIPGLELEMPNYGYGDDNPDEYERLREAHDALYQAANSAVKTQNYAEAIRLYEQFLLTYPYSDRTDDALYAIGMAYDALERYADSAESAKTPEQLAQVTADWQRVAAGFQEELIAARLPVRSAIDAYIALSQSMPGSDYRDDALYSVAADYEKLEDWVSACKAYLDLITIYPVGTYSNTAVSRLNALCEKLPSQADRATIFTTIMETFPHHSLSDDYLYKLAVQAVLDGNLIAARNMFARYGANYPHRSRAADALFWHARCEQLLGNALAAGPLYGKVARDFLQSGLADDAYVEYEYIRTNKDEKVIQAGVQALDKAAKAIKQPLVGYEAIAHEHILLMVPADKAIDVRAYNLPDVLEQAYGRLATFCGGKPFEGARIEIVVDPTAKTIAFDDPIRIPPNYIGPPPGWWHWFEALALAFINDPEIASITTAFPGLAQGMARFMALQLEDTLFNEMGELNVGATAVRGHLSDLNTTKSAAETALNKHVSAKATADKIDMNVGLGMIWSFSTRLADVSGELINWLPLKGLIPAARTIPKEIITQAQSLEQKAALVAYWINKGLGKDMTSVLKTWGFPINTAELDKIKAQTKTTSQAADAPATTSPG